ncbi:EamA family transporter [Dictyobacter arantiisoli]|nr:DMT family transporter [Dictyobacter arantiisoli]
MTSLLIGIWVALLWGLNDVLATFSVRRFTPLATTLLSQGSSLFALICVVMVVYGYPFFYSNFLVWSAILPGIVIGAIAALGYFALYRALELGPLMLTSPLASSSAAVTLILSTLFLQETLTPLTMVAIVCILAGEVCAVSHFPSLAKRKHPQKERNVDRLGTLTGELEKTHKLAMVSLPIEAHTTQTMMSYQKTSRTAHPWAETHPAPRQSTFSFTDLFRRLKLSLQIDTLKLGLFWTMVTMVAFGCMDFGLGTVAVFSNWLMPILWMRISSVILLLFVRGWQQKQEGDPPVHTEKPHKALWIFPRLSYDCFLPIIIGCIENLAILLFSLAAKQLHLIQALGLSRPNHQGNPLAQKESRIMSTSYQPFPSTDAPKQSKQSKQSNPTNPSSQPRRK